MRSQINGLIFIGNIRVINTQNMSMNIIVFIFCCHVVLCHIVRLGQQFYGWALSSPAQMCEVNTVRGPPSYCCVSE